MYLDEFQWRQTVWKKTNGVFDIILTQIYHFIIQPIIDFLKNQVFDIIS